MYVYSKPIQGFSSIRSTSVVKLVRDVETAPIANGYHPHVLRIDTSTVCPDSPMWNRGTWAAARR
jgi:hypothetical protein